MGSALQRKVRAPRGFRAGKDIKPRADYPALTRLLLSMQRKEIRSQTARFGLSQVNPFRGINEEKKKSQGTLQPHLSRAGGVSRGRVGILRSWWGLVLGRATLSPCSCCKIRGMLRDQPFHRIMGSPELEGSFPQGGLGLRLRSVAFQEPTAKGERDLGEGME